MNRLLGIDPGRSKTGLALTDGQGAILRLHIAQTGNMEQELRDFVKGENLEAVIMGDGTNHDAIGKAVAAVLPEVPLQLVGEAHSTEEARTLYWQENPPKGWKKLVPMGLLVPSVPLDAYAAVVQIRRYLAEKL